MALRSLEGRRWRPTRCPSWLCWRVHSSVGGHWSIRHGSWLQPTVMGKNKTHPYLLRICTKTNVYFLLMKYVTKCGFMLTSWFLVILVFCLKSFSKRKSFTKCGLNGLNMLNMYDPILCELVYDLREFAPIAHLIPKELNHLHMSLLLSPFNVCFLCNI